MDRGGWADLQSEYLWCVSGLDAVTLALPSVTCNDGEVRTSNGEDGASILCVGVELSLLGLCEGTVGHVGREERERERDGGRMFGEAGNGEGGREEKAVGVYTLYARE